MLQGKCNHFMGGSQWLMKISWYDVRLWNIWKPTQIYLMLMYQKKSLGPEWCYHTWIQNGRQPFYKAMDGTWWSGGTEKMLACFVHGDLCTNWGTSFPPGICAWSGRDRAQNLRIHTEPNSFCQACPLEKYDITGGSMVLCMIGSGSCTNWVVQWRVQFVHKPWCTNPAFHIDNWDPFMLPSTL